MMTWNDYRAECYYTQRRPYVTEFVLAQLRQLWARALCRLRGHKLEDHGYGNPDSGCIDIVCVRCGWSAGRQWLY